MDSLFLDDVRSDLLGLVAFTAASSDLTESLMEFDLARSAFTGLVLSAGTFAAVLEAAAPFEVVGLVAVAERPEVFVLIFVVDLFAEASAFGEGLEVALLVVLEVDFTLDLLELTADFDDFLVEVPD